MVKLRLDSAAATIAIRIYHFTREMIFVEAAPRSPLISPIRYNRSEPAEPQYVSPRS